MNMRFLKKNVVLIAVSIGVFLIGSAFIFEASKNNKTTTGDTLLINDNIEKVVTKAVSIDSDNDGLSDWEEILLKTNPQNPDTDGDGILDGQEDYKEKISTSDESGVNKIEELPNTEKLAFQLFEGYIDLKKRNYLGTSIEDNFVSGIVKNNLPTISYKTYTQNDIIIDTENLQDSKEDAIAYRDTLNVAWEPLFSIKEDELVAFVRIVEDNDENGFTQLNFAKSKHEEAIQNTLQVSVPPNAVSIHLDILNAFSFFTGVLDTMINVDNDPLTMLIAIDGYTRSEDIVKESIERLRTYLLTKGITE